MKRLELSPEAINDLRAIGRYSEQKWGKSRRDAYMAALVTAMDRLCALDLGRPRNDIKAGVWSQKSGRHVIIFRRNEELVRILSVVHERRDIASVGIENIQEEAVRFVR